MRYVISALLMVLPLILCAQQVVSYEGEPVGRSNKVKVTYMGKLDKSFKKPFQGMDIYKDYMLCLQHFGMASVYRIDGRKMTLKGKFKLGSFNDLPVVFNHANVASFGNRFLRKGDKLPLLYVTRCNASEYANGRHQVLFVEHVDPVGMKSELVQTISHQDEVLSTTHTTQWCVDAKNNLLYGLGNSKEGPNRHFIVKFRLPQYRGPQDSVVILRKSDELERYFIEDYYKRPDWQPLIQGMYIRENLLYLPWGVGKPSNPSVVYIWDLKNRRMRNAIELQNEIPYEMEDGSFLGRKDLIIQTAPGHIFKISFE